ncbi:hypothetical protein CISIN_1g033811mg [Citrus sinensis]|uniref:NPR1/NIM1-like C-terminal domain-containing protein n=1 Tax=Citrus sinensis TaxID=2711 RepID=A0A067D0V7_CITSI|nr:hypothetical protein CISIN_1g033811mg [Citrus sinensis]
MGTSYYQYILADPFVPYTSIVGSIFACAMLRRVDATALIARFWTVIGLMLPPRKWYSRRAETQRARFMELKEDLQKGFYKDMAEKNRSALSSSSSSSSSPKEGVKCKGRKR